MNEAHAPRHDNRHAAASLCLAQLVARVAAHRFPGKINPGTFVLTPVPEPSSLVLAGTAALAGLGAWARRRRKAIG